MSHAQPHREDDEQMEHDDSAQIQDEDIVEVVEDDGDEPMDEDDDDGDDGEGNANDKYDGEIVIGAPSNPEEEAMWREMNQDGDAQNRVDNSWAASALHAADKSVFTVSLHPSFPNPPLAVSGGEDDLAYIFCPLPGGEVSSSAGPAFEPIKLTGHKDSVVAAGWSSNGDMVATGGMDGQVRVWRRATGRKSGDAAAAAAAPAEEKTIDDYRRWEFLTSLETDSEINWLTWHPRGNVLAAGCEDGIVWMWSLPTGQTMAVLSAHTFPSTAGVFTETPRGLLTTALDSTLILWDPRESEPVWKTSVFAHPNAEDLDPAVSGITALALSPNGQLAAVGSANGLVKLVSVARGDVISRLEGHQEANSIEALEFVDLLAGAGGGKGVVLVSGGTDGKGFVWDVATGRVRAELQHDVTITSLAKHPAPTLHLVTSASADRSLKTWDVRTGSLVAHHQGHMGVVNGVQVARAPAFAGADGQGGQHGQVIVSAGDDGVSLIWRL